MRISACRAWFWVRHREHAWQELWWLHPHLFSPQTNLRALGCSGTFTPVPLAGGRYSWKHFFKSQEEIKICAQRNHLVLCTCRMHRNCIPTNVNNVLYLFPLVIWSACLNSFFICNLLLNIWLISSFISCLQTITNGWNFSQMYFTENLSNNFIRSLTSNCEYLV